MPGLFTVSVLVTGVAIGAPSTALELIPAVERGCAQRLVNKADHPFIEAQIACDAFVAFRLVDEIVDGRERETRVEALHGLVVDSRAPRTTGPFATTPTIAIADAQLPSSVLYRGYLLLMLAGLAHVDALGEHAPLYDAVASSLVIDFQQAEFLPSFGAGVWPCDNALAGAGLLLHGQQTGSASSRATGGEIVSRLEHLRAAPEGFVTKLAPVREPTPRGTVLAWTAAFLALADEGRAEPFAVDFVSRFCDSPVRGIAACREWPRGSDRGADAVSGPLIGGYGVGASALGIAATAPFDSLASWNQRLWALAKVGGMADITSNPSEYPLENAILLWGRTARSWGS